MAHPEVSILCLIGLPASGKTYLASLIAKDKLGFTDIKNFCYDDLIKWNTEKMAWKEERSFILLKVKDAITQFLNKKISNNRLLIVLDDNMFYRSMRYAFYKLAQKYRVKFCQVYIETSLITCLMRNYNRDQPLPTNHVLNVNEKMEVPSYYSSWEKNTITINGEKKIEKSLVEVKILLDSAGMPVELETKQELTKISKNLKHTADIALRRIISLIAHETKNEDKSNMAEKMFKLNKKKNEIMNLVNKNQLSLPSDENIDIYIKQLFPLMITEQTSSKINLRGLFENI